MENITIELVKTWLSMPAPTIGIPYGVIFGFLLVAYGVGSIILTKKKSVASILIGALVLALMGVL